MFTVFLVKKSESATDEELNKISSMLREYSMTFPGLWLQSLPWNCFEFRWCPEMNVHNGVMGCFTPFYPKTIFLQQFVHIDYDWIEQIFPTIVHEMRHAHQWKRSKIKYILCSLPVLRQYTLESDAKNEEEKAENFMQQ